MGRARRACCRISFACVPLRSLAFQTPFPDIANHPRRIAENKRIIRDVARYNRTPRHTRAFAAGHRQQCDAAAYGRATFDACRRRRPVLSDYFTAIIDGAGPQIVRENHAMSNEDVILNEDAFWNKDVRLDLAAGTDDGSALDFDKRPNPCFFTNCRAIDVDELRVINSSTRGNLRRRMDWHLSISLIYYRRF